MIKLSHNTQEIQARHLQHSRRQLQKDATPFKDNHYPTFYGGDFSNVDSSSTAHRPVN